MRTLQGICREHGNPVFGTRTVDGRGKVSRTFKFRTYDATLTNNTQKPLLRPRGSRAFGHVAEGGRSTEGQRDPNFENFRQKSITMSAVSILPKGARQMPNRNTLLHLPLGMWYTHRRHDTHQRSDARTQKHYLSQKGSAFPAYS